MPNPTPYQRQYYAQLNGATIICTGFAENRENPREPWPMLQIRTASGKIDYITVSCDPEGNAPGHLFINANSQEITT